MIYVKMSRITCHKDVTAMPIKTSLTPLSTVNPDEFILKGGIYDLKKQIHAYGERALLEFLGQVVVL